MNLNLERVRTAARTAATDDLLDRVTVFRGGMEPDALEVLEEELYRRGVSATDIRRHADEVEWTVVWERPGLARRCAFCARPAIRVERRWQRLLGLVPLFPRAVACCAGHAQV